MVVASCEPLNDFTGGFAVKLDIDKWELSWFESLKACNVSQVSGGCSGPDFIKWVMENVNKSVFGVGPVSDFFFKFRVQGVEWCEGRADDTHTCLTHLAWHNQSCFHSNIDIATTLLAVRMRGSSQVVSLMNCLTMAVQTPR